MEAQAREAGFLVNAVAADVIRLAPPLTLSVAEADLSRMHFSDSRWRIDGGGVMSDTTTSVRIATKVARHQRIIGLLERNEVSRRANCLSCWLPRASTSRRQRFRVTLDELRAVKVQSSGGMVVYAVPSDGGDPSQ